MPRRTGRLLLSGLLWVWKAKAWAIGVCMTVLTVVFTTIVFLEVIWRYVLGSTLNAEDYAVFAAVWAYFLGSAYAAFERTHLAAPLLSLWLPGRVSKLVVETTATLITVIVSIWFLMLAYDYVSWSYRTSPKSLELGLGLIWVHASALVGLGLMTLYFAVELGECLWKLFHSTRPSLTAASKGFE